MSSRKRIEQHIAVFGESGSGKTVMLSSFYGAAQEPQNIKQNRFHIVADNPSQGTLLDQNYLGMKKSAKAPEPTRFSSHSYVFAVKLKDWAAGKGKGVRSFDALRLVWHDYPGEWLEQDVSGPTEATDRLDTFRNLLASDVAVLLVDGQRLVDNSGEEERYLSSLLGNFRNSLLRLKDDLLVGGKPLVSFPRIWVVGLSKSDLLPELDVHEFKNLIIEKARDHVEEVRDVLSSLVESSAALSIGEDFLLLSSAKFDPGKIQVAERVGVDLILPLAAVLPFERHVRWAQAGQVSRRVAQELVQGIGSLAAALGGIGALTSTLVGRKNKLLGALGLLLTHFGSSLGDAAHAGDSKLREVNALALEKRDTLRATLTGFRMDLDRGEEAKVFLRSLR